MFERLVSRCGAAGAAAVCLTIGLGAQARFSTSAELVVLHVAVTRDGGYVAGLARDSFTVFDDGVAQPVVVFSADAAPVTVGLLLDDSASMIGLRAQVSAAAETFAATSHPADEVFALTFNDRVESVLPPRMPFTSDSGVLRTFLQHAISGRGRTALYDAVDAGVAYLAGGTHARKALIIISDGGDNASRHTSADMQRLLAAANAVVYTVGLRHAADADANPGLLARLARSTGGLSFTPGDPRRIESALMAIARDIRSTYTVAYAVPPGAAGIRHVRVSVRSDGRVLDARTRREYLAR